ncbi:MAG: Xaa-Pro dipeptidase [Pelagibacterales bacterium]|jgi:Xaa-Pro dipeptidase|nr:Xaa-Pro dipeptidase [Pelagibacterales bacterium]
MLIIEDKELKDRVEILRKEIKSRNLNGIIIYSDEYRSGYCTYFTGYKPINVIEESPQTLIIMENEDPILVIGRLNYYSARETVWIKNILQHHKFDTEISSMLEKFNKKGSKIGIAGEHLMPFYLRDLFTKAMPDVNFPIVTEILDDMRKIKSPQEILLMEKAAEINDKVLTKLKSIIKIGMTEQQVVAHADFLGRQMGADLGSATVVMSGKNTKFPAWRATDKKINKGELVMVDFNPAIGYYCNDGGLTFLMPGASKYKSDALKNSHKIIKKTINSIRSQTKATNVHDSFYDLLKPLSLEPNFSPYVTGTRGTGHGVGLDVVEYPDLNKFSDFIFYPNMTFAIKLDLHDLEGEGLRVEQVVQITEEGVKPLNKLALNSTDDWAIL